MVFVTGAAELHHIADLCRTAGVGFGADVVNGVMRGEGRIARAVKASALAKLPKRGGLNEWAADSEVRFKPRAGAGSAVVLVEVGRGSKIGGRAYMTTLDDGIANHPFYGRSPWYTTSVAPNAISDPIVEEGGDLLEQAVLDRATHVTERIAHG